MIGTGDTGEGISVGLSRSNDSFRFELEFLTPVFDDDVSRLLRRRRVATSASAS